MIQYSTWLIEYTHLSKQMRYSNCLQTSYTRIYDLEGTWVKIE